MTTTEITQEILIQKLQSRGFTSYIDVAKPTRTSLFKKMDTTLFPKTRDGKHQQVLVHLYEGLRGAINQDPCVEFQVTGDCALSDAASASVTLTNISYQNAFDEQTYNHIMGCLVAAWCMMVAPIEDLEAVDPDDYDTDGPIAGGMW